MAFTVRTPGVCGVTIASDVDLESDLLQQIFDRAMPDSVDGVVEAFAARAESLYGARCISPSR